MSQVYLEPGEDGTIFDSDDPVEILIAAFTGATPKSTRAEQSLAENKSTRDYGGFEVSNGGSTLKKTIGSGKLSGYTLELDGAGLGVNGNTVPNAGTVSHILLRDGGGTAVLNMFLYDTNTLVTDIVGAIKAGSGTIKPQNYSELFDLLIPTFVTIYGGKHGETFQGNTGADFFYGKAGKDKLYLWKGDDLFNGGKGSDTVDASWQNKAITANLDKGWVKYGTDKATLKNVENVTGSKKDDTIVGNSAANMLAGMKGNDKLTGKGGKDKFVFKPNQGIDVITDFQNGKDKLDLKGFKFKSKAAALKHFSEVGGKNDDICKFKFDGTIVKIKGVDLKNIDGSDIII